MKQNTKDDKTLRAYLLGDLSEKEQEEVDSWLLVDDDAYNLMVASEDDLIEDSLSGRLTAHERERLNSHFLISEERQRKLQFSRTFHNFVQTAKRPKAKTSFWDLVASFFKLHATLAYSTSGLILLSLIGNIWLFSRTSHLQLQLADASLQREDAARQLELRQAQLRSYGKVLTAEQPLLAMQTTNLSPLTLRSAGDIRKIEISSNTHVFKFALQLLDDSHFDSYKAVLSGANDQALFSDDDLHATAGPEMRAVIFAVPVDNLKAGEYRIQLTGIAKSTSEEVGSFKFLAVRH